VRDVVRKRDAAHYITKLRKAEHDGEECQAAMQALLLVAENDGPTMFARIGVMKALNRNFERTLTDRKEMHWGKRKLKLKRDE
jgi:monoamine oxidase